MPLIRVAPSAISGNNAWGMVPSSWRVPGDLDNHGRYHFYFPLSILVHPDDDHPNPISASRYPQRPSTQTLRRSGGLRPLEAVLAASPCSQALHLSLACSYSARGPSSSPRMIDFRRGSRWGQDVPSLLGCTRSTLKQGTHSARL